MADEGKLGKAVSFMEKAQNVATVIVGLQTLPVIGNLIKKIFGVVEKKTNEAFGISISASGDGPDEEMLTKMVFIELSDPDRLKFLEFAAKLKQHPERGKDKLAAFYFSIANLVLKNSRKNKRKIGGGGKGKDPAEIEEYQDFEPGIRYAKRFVEFLLSKENFDEIYEILETLDEFSSLKKIGPTPAGIAVKKAFGWGKDKTKEMKTDQQENIEDLNKKAGQFERWAKKLYEDQK